MGIRGIRLAGPALGVLPGGIFVFGETAVVLNFAEFGEVVAYVAVEAGFVEGIEIELLLVVDGDLEFVGGGEEEEGLFDAADAVDAPVVVGDGLGEAEFEFGDRVEGGDDAFAVAGVVGLVFVGHEAHEAGESVFEAVEAGGGFAGFGTGAGGMGGVFAIGGGLLFCGHESVLLARDLAGGRGKMVFALAGESGCEAHFYWVKIYFTDL